MLAIKLVFFSSFKREKLKTSLPHCYKLNKQRIKISEIKKVKKSRKYIINVHTTFKPTKKEEIFCKAKFYKTRKQLLCDTPIHRNSKTQQRNIHLKTSFDNGLNLRLY